MTRDRRLSFNSTDSEDQIDSLKVKKERIFRKGSAKYSSELEQGKRRKYRAVATLIIAPAHVSDNAVKMFIKTPEVDSLVSIYFNEVTDGKLHQYVPHYKLKKAKKIYKDAKVQPGYLHAFILKNRPDIVKNLLELPKEYKLICQVECPTKEIKKYKNIDVGFTSNGKCEARDNSLMGCAIRETFEEARIILSERYFCPVFQSKQREKLNINLPLYFSYSNTFCYILVL